MELDALNRFILKVNYMIFGQPRYIDKELLRCSILSPKEREDMKFFGTKTHFIQAAYVIYLIITIVEHYSFIIYTLVRVGNLTTDITNHRDGSYRYNCLITNCTELRPNVSILKDLGRFPWLTLCDPQIASWSNPFIDCDIFGLIGIAFQYYLAMAMGILVPVLLYYKPMIQELYTLQIAPQLVLMDNINRIKGYFVVVYKSFKCYCIAIQDDQIDVAQGTRMSTSINIPHELFSIEEQSMRILRKDYKSLNSRTQAFIRDTLPFIRTHNYLIIAKGLFAFRYIMTVSNLIFAFAVAILASTYKLQERRSVFNQISNYTKSSGCKIITEAGSELDFDNIIDDWSVSFVVEFALTFLPIIMGISLFSLFQVMAVEELHIMHVEQMDRIKLILHISKMLKQNQEIANEFSTIGFNVESCLDDFELDAIRLSHDGNLRIFLGFTYLKPLSHIDIDKIAIDSLVENGVSLDVYLSLLTKIYVGNRHLLYYIKECERGFNKLVTYCYGTSYALAMIYIFFGYRLRQSDNETAMMSVLSLLISNALISYIRKVQSSTTKLIKSMWSVIAEIEHFNDIRIKHMRLLWTRQAIIFLADGVVVLRAFGIPVSHANITEILLWSSILAIYLTY